MNQLNADDWDVLIYVASYIAGYASRPSYSDLESAGLPANAVNQLLSKGLLAEVDNGLEPVLHRTRAVMWSAA